MWRRLGFVLAGGVLGGCVLFGSFGDLEGDGGSDASIDVASDDAPATIEASKQDGSSASDYAAQVMIDSPIAYYRLGDTGNVAVDSTSHHLDGSYGPTTSHVPGLIAGDSDGAVLFGGVLADGGNVVGVGVPRNTLLEPVNAISIEFWMKPLSTSSAELASYGAQTAAPYQPWDVQIDTGGGAFPFSTLFYTSDAGYLRGSSPYSTNTIYHVVATFDGTTLRTYTNGDADGVSGASGLLGNYGSTPGLGIGSGAAGGFPFTGVMDEVAIYDHELKADRIVAHYSAGK